MIRLASDIHLEFYLNSVLSEGNEVLENLINDIFTPMDTDKNTVLILAGDILLIKQFQHFKYFFEKLSSKFKTVLWVFGNHEWFKATINKKTVDNLKNELKYLENIHILNNDTFEDDNYIFIGSTLWSDLKKGDYLTALDVAKVSHDYKKITFQEGANYSKLRPRHVSKMFMDNESFIFSALNKFKDSVKKKVVVTHHPPTIKAIPDYIKENPDFWSDFGNVNFDKFIENNVMPDIWLHGHIHENQKLDVMGLPILSNTWGYNDVKSDGSSYLNDGFESSFFLKI